MKAATTLVERSDDSSATFAPSRFTSDLQFEPRDSGRVDRDRAARGRLVREIEETLYDAYGSRQF